MTNHEALRIIYEFCKENSEKDQKTAFEVGKAVGVLSRAVDEEVERIQKSVPYEEIEKAYESILDVEAGGYVDIEEVKVHFCKWLGKEDI